MNSLYSADQDQKLKAGLFTFTEETLTGKFHFLCSGYQAELVNIFEELCPSASEK